jgi:iron complex outermembrane receptor protein
MALISVSLKGWAQEVEEAGEESSYVYEVREETNAQEAAHSPTGTVTWIPTATAYDRLTTVSQLLEKAAGVVTRRLGGPGAMAMVSLRGASSYQVSVLLDGMPINTGANPVADVDLVLPDLLSHLVVYRSGTPLWLAGGALGGAVNLITRNLHSTRFSLSTSAGSLFTRKVNSTTYIPLERGERGSVLLAAGYLGSRGDFLFYDDLGTPYNGEDDVERRRQNNSFNRGQLMLSANFLPREDLRIKWLSLANGGSTGVPGIGLFQSSSTRLEQFRTMNQLALVAHGFPGHQADTVWRIYGDYQWSRFSDPEGETGLGRRESFSENTVFGGIFRMNWYPVERLEIQPALDLYWEGFGLAEDDETRPPAVESSRVLAAPILELALRGEADRWVISAGSRVNFSSSHQEIDIEQLFQSPREPGDSLGVHWSAQGGGRFQFWQGELSRFAIQTNFGRFSRLPGFLEMFGDTGAVVGNPELKPETVLSMDVGLNGEWSNLEHRGDLAITGFYSSYDELIQFIQNSQQVARPENISAAVISGLECAVNWSWSDSINVHTAYTFTHSEDLGVVQEQAGNPLPGRPSHGLSGRIETLWRGAQLAYWFDYQSDQNLDRSGFQRSAQRITHSALLGYSWSGINLTLEGQNLMDHRVETVPLLPQPPGVEVETVRAVSDYLGYPLPGRLVFVTFTWEGPA